MTSFHPTLSPAAFATYLWRARLTYDLTTCLTERFPDHRADPTDSGRSAFARTLEALDLQGKTLLMPAYVCDAFYPVLKAYDIDPIFLDIDPETFQPPVSAYTDELLMRADAALLVATYGRRLDEAVLSLLADRHVTIIEDHAMRSPLTPDPLRGAARIYSLPKTLPVPDGGLAILPKGATVDPRPPHRVSLTFAKNVLKLLPIMGPLIAFVRDTLSHGQATPTWGGTRGMSALTRAVVADRCNREESAWAAEPFPYCLPIRTSDPARAARILVRRGVHAELIWSRPIVMNPDVCEHYGIDPSAFPETVLAAHEIVCAPLWHIPDDETYERYTRFLEKVLADFRRK